MGDVAEGISDRNDEDTADGKDDEDEADVDDDRMPLVLPVLVDVAVTDVGTGFKMDANSEPIRESVNGCWDAAADSLTGVHPPKFQSMLSPYDRRLLEYGLP